MKENVNKARSWFLLVMVAGVACVCAAAAPAKSYYCKYCGTKFSSVRSLTASKCQRHPDGAANGNHALYEGSEKDSYTCKYCGTTATQIRSLTASKCQRHPDGPAKGYHAPAL